MSCNVIQPKICCYITCFAMLYKINMLYNMCHVMLYNIKYVTLYNKICYAI